MSETPSPETTRPKPAGKHTRLWEVLSWLGTGLVAAPFQDTDPGPGEPTEGTSLLAGAVESWTSHGSGGPPRPRAVLVPGALVSYLSEQGERVYGWQP